MSGAKANTAEQWFGSSTISLWSGFLRYNKDQGVTWNSAPELPEAGVSVSVSGVRDVLSILDELLSTANQGTRLDSVKKLALISWGSAPNSSESDLWQLTRQVLFRGTMMTLFGSYTSPSLSASAESLLQLVVPPTSAETQPSDTASHARSFSASTLLLGSASPVIASPSPAVRKNILFLMQSLLQTSTTTTTTTTTRSTSTSESVTTSAPSISAQPDSSFLALQRIFLSSVIVELSVLPSVLATSRLSPTSHVTDSSATYVTNETLSASLGSVHKLIESSLFDAVLPSTSTSTSSSSLGSHPALVASLLSACALALDRAVTGTSRPFASSMSSLSSAPSVDVALLKAGLLFLRQLVLRYHGRLQATFHHSPCSSSYSSQSSNAMLDVSTSSASQETSYEQAITLHTCSIIASLARALRLGHVAITKDCAAQAAHGIVSLLVLVPNTSTSTATTAASPAVAELMFYLVAAGYCSPSALPYLSHPVVQAVTTAFEAPDSAPASGPMCRAIDPVCELAVARALMGVLDASLLMQPVKGQQQQQQQHEKASARATDAEDIDGTTTLGTSRNLFEGWCLPLCLKYMSHEYASEDSTASFVALFTLDAWLKALQKMIKTANAEPMSTSTPPSSSQSLFASVVAKTSMLASVTSALAPLARSLVCPVPKYVTAAQNVFVTFVSALSACRQLIIAHHSVDGCAGAVDIGPDPVQVMLERAFQGKSLAASDENEQKESLASSASPATTFTKTTLDLVLTMAPLLGPKAIFASRPQLLDELIDACLSPTLASLAARLFAALVRISAPATTSTSTSTSEPMATSDVESIHGAASTLLPFTSRSSWRLHYMRPLIAALVSPNPELRSSLSASNSPLAYVASGIDETLLPSLLEAFSRLPQARAHHFTASAAVEALTSGTSARPPLYCASAVSLVLEALSRTPTPVAQEAYLSVLALGRSIGYFKDTMGEGMDVYYKVLASIASTSPASTSTSSSISSSISTSTSSLDLSSFSAATSSSSVQSASPSLLSSSSSSPSEALAAVMLDPRRSLRTSAWEAMCGPTLSADLPSPAEINAFSTAFLHLVHSFEEPSLDLCHVIGRFISRCSTAALKIIRLKKQQQQQQHATASTNGPQSGAAQSKKAKKTSSSSAAEASVLQVTPQAEALCDASLECVRRTVMSLFRMCLDQQARSATCAPAPSHVLHFAFVLLPILISNEATRSALSTSADILRARARAVAVAAAGEDAITSLSSPLSSSSSAFYGVFTQPQWLDTSSMFLSRTEIASAFAATLTQQWQKLAQLPFILLDHSDFPSVVASLVEDPAASYASVMWDWSRVSLGLKGVVFTPTDAPQSSSAKVVDAGVASPFLVGLGQALGQSSLKATFNTSTLLRYLFVIYSTFSSATSPRATSSIHSYVRNILSSTPSASASSSLSSPSDSLTLQVRLHECIPLCTVHVHQLLQESLIPAPLALLASVVAAFDSHLSAIHEDLVPKVVSCRRPEKILDSKPTPSSSSPDASSSSRIISLAKRLHGLCSALAFIRSAVLAAPWRQWTAPSHAEFASWRNTLPSTLSDLVSSKVVTVSLADPALVSATVLTTAESEEFLSKLRTATTTTATSSTAAATSARGGGAAFARAAVTSATALSLASGIVERVLAVGSLMTTLHTSSDVSLRVQQDETIHSLNGADDADGAALTGTGLTSQYDVLLVKHGFGTSDTKASAAIAHSLLHDVDVDCRGHVFVKSQYASNDSSVPASDVNSPSVSNSTVAPTSNAGAAKMIAATSWQALRELCLLITQWVASPNHTRRTLVPTAASATSATALSSKQSQSSHAQLLPSTSIMAMDALVLDLPNFVSPVAVARCGSLALRLLLSTKHMGVHMVAQTALEAITLALTAHTQPSYQAIVASWVDLLVHNVHSSATAQDTTWIRRGAGVPFAFLALLRGSMAPSAAQLASSSTAKTARTSQIVVASPADETKRANNNSTGTSTSAAAEGDSKSSKINQFAASRNGNDSFTTADADATAGVDAEDDGKGEVQQQAGQTGKRKTGSSTFVSDPADIKRQDVRLQPGAVECLPPSTSSSSGTSAAASTDRSSSAAVAVSAADVLARLLSIYEWSLAEEASNSSHTNMTSSGGGVVAKHAPRASPGCEWKPRVQALNIARAICRDSQLAATLPPQLVSRALVTSLRGMESANWNVRNSARLAFASIASRMLRLQLSENEFFGFTHDPLVRAVSSRTFLPAVLADCASSEATTSAWLALRSAIAMNDSESETAFSSSSSSSSSSSNSSGSAMTATAFFTHYSTSTLESFVNVLTSNVASQTDASYLVLVPLLMIISSLSPDSMQHYDTLANDVANPNANGESLSAPIPSSLTNWITQSVESLHAEARALSATSPQTLTTTFILRTLAPLVSRCLVSDSYHVRVMASKALVALVPVSLRLNLFHAAVQTFRSVTHRNALHALCTLVVDVVDSGLRIPSVELGSDGQSLSATSLVTLNTLTSIASAAQQRVEAVSHARSTQSFEGPYALTTAFRVLAVFSDMLTAAQRLPVWDQSQSPASLVEARSSYVRLWTSCTQLLPSLLDSALQSRTVSPNYIDDAVVMLFSSAVMERHQQSAPRSLSTFTSASGSEPISSTAILSSLVASKCMYISRTAQETVAAILERVHSSARCSSAVDAAALLQKLCHQTAALLPAGPLSLYYNAGGLRYLLALWRRDKDTFSTEDVAFVDSLLQLGPVSSENVSALRSSTAAVSAGSEVSYHATGVVDAHTPLRHFELFLAATAIDRFLSSCITSSAAKANHVPLADKAAMWQAFAVRIVPRFLSRLEIALGHPHHQHLRHSAISALHHSSLLSLVNVSNHEALLRVGGECDERDATKATGESSELVTSAVISAWKLVLSACLDDNQSVRNNSLLTAVSALSQHDQPQQRIGGERRSDGTQVEEVLTTTNHFSSPASSEHLSPVLSWQLEVVVADLERSIARLSTAAILAPKMRKSLEQQIFASAKLISSSTPSASKPGMHIDRKEAGDEEEEDDQQIGNDVGGEDDFVVYEEEASRSFQCETLGKSIIFKFLNNLKSS